MPLCFKSPQFCFPWEAFNSGTLEKTLRILAKCALSWLLNADILNISSIFPFKNLSIQALLSNTFSFN